MAALTAWPLPITGHKGYALAEVGGLLVPGHASRRGCSSMAWRHGSLRDRACLLLQVTGGGVRLEQVDLRTMESRVSAHLEVREQLLRHQACTCTRLVRINSSSPCAASHCISTCGHPCTMQVQPRLFLCGEVLDVFGRIGGFNFYSAWLQGRLAGLGAAAAAVSSKLGTASAAAGAG